MGERWDIPLEIRKGINLQTIWWTQGRKKKEGNLTKRGRRLSEGIILLLKG